MTFLLVGSGVWDVRLGRHTVGAIAAEDGKFHASVLHEGSRREFSTLLEAQHYFIGRFRNG